MTASGAENEDDPVSPPWGALPAEDYLIRNWNWGSTDSPSVQRLKLIRRFLELRNIDDLDVLGSNRDIRSRQGLPLDVDAIVLPRPPTSREVERILKPWRPIRLRRIAVDYWMKIWSIGDEATWLRTYYGPGSDDIWQQFMEKEENWNPRFDDDLRARLLSDISCFNFGEHWDLTFDILPEVFGYPPPESWIRHVEESRRQIKLLMQAPELKEQEPKEKEEQIVWEVHFMQAGAFRKYLVVADEEAFTTGKLRLIFYDTMRNIVRHGRIPVEEAHMVTAYQGQGQTIEQYWTDNNDTYCELGDKYLPDGELGDLLYGFEDPVLTQKLREVMDDWEPKAK